MALAKEVKLMMTTWRRHFSIKKEKPQLRQQALPTHTQKRAPSSSLPRWETVHSVAALPKISRIYTAADGAFALPSSLCQALVAIGDDAQQVWLLVDPDTFSENAIQLDSLHARLLNEHICVTKIAFASAALIASIYQTELQEKWSDEEGKSSEEGHLFDEFIHYGLTHEASDIHFIVKGKNAQVKYRIHGEMESMRNATNGSYTREQIRGALGYAYNKLLAEKTNSHSQFTPEQSQSCMIPYRVGDKEMNLRWQSSRGFASDGYAFTVFIRYLKREALTVQAFQELGYSDDQAAIWKRIAANCKGLVLVSGITNSGKSTTLTFYLETLPEREKLNIITVEDPAEREIDTASLQISLQRTLAVDAEKTPFTEVQGVLVRSDPDVIMLGEIRDVASGICAQTLLQTGHQVLATTHAMGVMEVFGRLSSSEIGFSMYSLTRRKFWSLIVYQALVPKLCPTCCEAADKTVPEITQLIHQRFHINTTQMRTRALKGCASCDYRGIKGVTVVAEMMQPTRPFLSLMREGKDDEAERLWRSASDGRFDTPNMRGKTVFEHALYKAYCGLIDPRTVESFELLDQYEILGGVKQR